MPSPLEIDFLDPFRTLAPENPEFSRADEALALRQLALREQLIEDYLSGVGLLDDVLDCISDHQIDPDHWIDQACRNIEVVIDSGIRFVRDERGLFLPS